MELNCWCAFLDQRARVYISRCDQAALKRQAGALDGSTYGEFVSEMLGTRAPEGRLIAVNWRGSMPPPLRSPLFPWKDKRVIRIGRARSISFYFVTAYFAERGLDVVFFVYRRRDATWTADLGANVKSSK